MFKLIQIKTRSSKRTIKDVKLIESILKKSEKLATHFDDMSTMNACNEVMQDVANIVLNLNTDAYTLLQLICSKLKNEQLKALLNKHLKLVDATHEESVINVIKECYTTLYYHDPEREKLAFCMLKQREHQTLQTYYGIVCKKYLHLKSLGIELSDNIIKDALCNLHNVVDKINAEQNVTNGEIFINNLLAEGILSKSKVSAAAEYNKNKNKNNSQYLSDTESPGSKYKRTLKRNEKKKNPGTACYFCGEKS